MTFHIFCVTFMIIANLWCLFQCHISCKFVTRQPVWKQVCWPDFLRGKEQHTNATGFTSQDFFWKMLGSFCLEICREGRTNPKGPTVWCIGFQGDKLSHRMNTKNGQNFVFTNFHPRTKSKSQRNFLFKVLAVCSRYCVVTGKFCCSYFVLSRPILHLIRQKLGLITGLLLCKNVIVDMSLFLSFRDLLHSPPIRREHAMQLWDE